MVVQLVPERGWRGPGCDDRCRTIKALIPGVFGRSELLLHDPRAHEEYGRGPLGALIDQPVVTSSGLRVDAGRFEVTADGRTIALTPTEMKLLVALARRLDLVVLQEDLIVAGWSQDYLTMWPVQVGHLLRVNIGRLRARLGAMGGLVRTVPGLGYRLLAIDPGMPAPPSQHARQLPVGAWSRDWAACRRCGRTDRVHCGKGYCTSCHKYATQHGLEPYGSNG